VVPRKIVQKWRFNTWSEGTFILQSNVTVAGLYSTVTIELEEKDGKTLLKLEQSGVPEEDRERTENGWSINFWRRIKGIFGYGPIM
jgi:activator of HSP90 ATPase